MYICPSQSVTDTSLVASKSYLQLFLWPAVALYIFITFWTLDSCCFQFFAVLVAVSSASDRGSQCAIFCSQSPPKSLRSTGMLGKMVSVNWKGFLVCGDQRHWGLGAVAILLQLSHVCKFALTAGFFKLVVWSMFFFYRETSNDFWQPFVLPIQGYEPVTSTMKYHLVMPGWRGMRCVDVYTYLRRYIWIHSETYVYIPIPTCKFLLKILCWPQNSYIYMYVCIQVCSLNSWGY